MMAMKVTISLRARHSWRTHGEVVSLEHDSINGSANMLRAIHHDAECFHLPENFIPERFEDNEFGLRPDIRATEGFRKTYGFGAGRRICPGSHLAENSLVRSSTFPLHFYIGCLFSNVKRKLILLNLFGHSISLPGKMRSRNVNSRPVRSMTV
jgi:hypothetical protein